MGCWSETQAPEALPCGCCKPKGLQAKGQALLGKGQAPGGWRQGGAPLLTHFPQPGPGDVAVGTGVGGAGCQMATVPLPHTNPPGGLGKPLALLCCTLLCFHTAPPSREAPGRS